METTPDPDELVWINVDQIAYLLTESNTKHQWTQIGFAGNTWVSTSLTPQEVVDLLHRAVEP